MKQIYLKSVMTALFMVFSLGLAFAQNMTVRGTVTDNTGEPMIGVSVLEKGTTNGVVTDLDGNYSVQVKSGATLVFSYVGYITVEKKAVAGKMDLVMQEDSKSLEELVVVGYGVQKKSSVTGAISSVKAADMENRTISDATQALQGKTAGVLVISNSAAPGASPAVRVRGYSSNSSSNPLYVVDGLRTTSISNLDPNDIESMEVLKDAASAAIYGAEAGNGVVLITTKKAKKGVRRIIYDFQISSQSLGKKPKMMNASQYETYMVEAGLISQETFNKYNVGADTDWMDVAFENSLMTKHNLSFSGANDQGSLFASLSYTQNNGPIVTDQDSFDRFTGTINADYKISDRIKFSTNNTITRHHQQTVAEGSATGSIMLSAMHSIPNQPVVYPANALPDKMQAWLAAGYKLYQDADGNYYSGPIYQDSNNMNPYTMLAMGRRKNSGTSITGSTALDINLFEGLTFTSRLGYRFINTTNYSYTAPYYSCSDLHPTYYSVSATDATINYYQWENFANYVTTIADKHNIAAMVGMSFSENTTFSTGGNIVGSTSDLGITKDDPNYAYFAYKTGSATQTVSGGEKLKTTQLSYFGRLSYDYKNTYFAQFSLRADAADTSILPLAKRWGYFPAGSLGWTISNEPFMQGTSNWLTHMKLRGSWGQNGSIAGLGSWMYDSVIGSTIKYPFTNSAAYSVGSMPTATGNPELKWETSEQIDLGLDLRFLRDRLGFTVDYFIKKTKDLIIPSGSFTPSLIVGNTASPINAGNVENKGFEFELSWRDNIGDFSYSISGNLATLKNKVTYLTDMAGDRMAGGSAGSGTVNYFEEGMPIWYMRGYKFSGVDSNGNPMFYTAAGQSVPASEITTNDQQMIGSAIPDFTYGVTLTAAYKGLDLTVFGSGSHGNEVFIGYDRASRTMANRLETFFNNRVSKGGDAILPSNPYWTQYLMSSAMVRDGSYFKIKQIQLGYSFPKALIKKIKLSNVRVYVSLDDFFTFTSYPGFDPEFTATGNAMGIDLGSYPSSKKIVGGINVTF